MNREKRGILVAAALHIVLALVVSFPLAGNFNSGIPYAHRVDPGWETVYMRQGDHLQFFYTLSLFDDYVRNETRPFFADPYMFRTAETEKYFVTRELPLSIAFFLLSPFGYIPAYNLLTVLSFVACGLGMFMLAGMHVKNFSAKLFASVIFTFFPFRLAQLFGGHPNGFLLFLIPFMVYGYERWFGETRLKYLLLAGVCMMAMTMEELHLGYFSALFTLAFVVYKGVSMLAGAPPEERLPALRRFVTASFGILGIWMVAGGYIAYIRNVIFSVAEVGEGRELWEIGIYAPRLVDFIRRGSMDAEKVIYPGIFSIVAAAFAFVRKKGAYRPPPAAWFYVFITVVTAILSLGPNLRGVPLYSFFYNHVPFFHYPRSTARIFVFTVLALSILGAYGVERLASAMKSAGKARILAPAFIVLALFDYQSFRSIGVSILPEGNAVYEHVKKQDDPGYLLEVPIWPGDSAWSSVYQYYNTIYRLPIVNGYSPFVSGAYIDEIFWPLITVNMGVIDAPRHERLRELGVKYITLHGDAYPFPVSPFPFRLALSNMRKSPFLEFVKDDNYVYLFRVRETVEDAGAVHSLPSSMGVFYEAEHMHSQMAKVEFDEEASGGFARFADSTTEGLEFVLFGPYRFFPPGDYRVVFRVKGDAAEPEEDFAVFDVAGREGTKVFAEKTLRGAGVSGVYADYALEFSIDDLEILEFRLKWAGNGKIWADYVYVTFLEEEDPVERFEAAEMFNARGGLAYGLAELHPPHNIAWGGNRRYEPGDYEARFRLAVGELTANTAAEVRVLHAGTGAVLAGKKVSGTDFEREFEFSDIAVPFSLERKEVLGFEVFFTREADLWAESISIIPAGRRKSGDFSPLEIIPEKLSPGVVRREYRNVFFAGESAEKFQPVPGGRLEKGGSYEWSGYIKAGAGGHRLGVMSKGSTYVYADGRRVLSAGPHPSLRYVKARLDIQEDTLLPVLLRHVPEAENAFLRLYWKAPGDDFPVPLPVKRGFFSHIPWETGL